MAEMNTTVTFRPDIDGPSIPTYMMLTGDYLRKLHISKEYGTQIVNWVADGIDPLCVPAEEMQEHVEKWTKEAETLYPGEGDHRVRLLDDQGNRIPIGSDVEFIIEEDQVEVPNCDAGDCIEYLWDLSGQRPEGIAEMEYVRCNGTTVTIQDYVRNLGVNVFLCLSKDEIIKGSPHTYNPTGQSCRT